MEIINPNENPLERRVKELENKLNLISGLLVKMNGLVLWLNKIHYRKDNKIKHKQIHELGEN